MRPGTLRGVPAFRLCLLGVVLLLVSACASGPEDRYQTETEVVDPPSDGGFEAENEDDDDSRSSSERSPICLDPSGTSCN
ncbi:hypothetical protein LRD18_07645 [Halorhodospira halochloris]|uniref:hypothetical protein n=1 Tax=Halorhodospira halochloris TaxID=1052 RepID=UPI001EE927BF|nr:hypothetical protein [Halorhodospira halochloris]MCG5530749.1 hypothetical protein [Halorhodospira halochloris]MCG5549015.1 hypothetical protein [Halorhodospira halochloris]